MAYATFKLCWNPRRQSFTIKHSGSTKYIEWHCTETLEINGVGVPRASTLWPLFLVLSINDLPIKISGSNASSADEKTKFLITFNSHLGPV